MRYCISHQPGRDYPLDNEDADAYRQKIYMRIE